MTRFDPETLMKILGSLGFSQTAFGKSELSITEIDGNYSDLKHHLSYLFEEDFIDLRHEDGLVVELESGYGELARELDSSLRVEGLSQAEKVLSEDLEEPERILSPRTNSPKETPDQVERDEQDKMPLKYDVILYPFGRASLRGSSRRELKKSHVRDISESEKVSPEIEILEAVNWLEKVYRNENGETYYRLVEDEPVRQYVENLAACINYDYDGEIDEFRQNPARWKQV